MKKLLTILALALGVSVNAQTGNTSTGTSALAYLLPQGIIIQLLEFKVLYI